MKSANEVIDEWLACFDAILAPLYESVAGVDQGVAEKIEEEIREYLDTPSVEEAADVVLCFLARYRYMLVAEMERKVKINQERVWVPVPGTTTFRHMEE